MTDAAKLPVQANFWPMALTGTASASAGDKIGDACAEIVTWLIQLACHCTPPTGVIGAVHTICVAGIVFIAFLGHYQFLVKPKQ